MAFSELIKNFEKIRTYMREFYVYGFKSRNEYDAGSTRTYDEEKRRIQSWLGDYVSCTQTPEGKIVFLSVDSRTANKNPFYKAWKAKSFTDGDITLHFLIFDILYSPEIKKTLSEIISEIDDRISFSMTFDESTIRKKLKEYNEEGIIQTEKNGRKVLYSRSAETDISGLNDVIDFFSETAPCGVVGSFLQDKLSQHNDFFSFKHHYITQALDSDVMALLFEAMSRKSYVTVTNLGRHSDKAFPIKLVPLRIYISSRTGRQYLIAFSEKTSYISSFRLDYLTEIKIEKTCDYFDKIRSILGNLEQNIWGVNCNYNIKKQIKETEHVEFEIKVNDDEQYIVQRLQREKRCGIVEKIDNHKYRFSADVFDTSELIPWIRTFISRITKLSFSDCNAEKKFKNDIQQMYEMYGLEGGGLNDIQ